MTVKELKELLCDAPDDMEVMIPFDADHLGVFGFRPACICETGIAEIDILAPGLRSISEEIPENIFLIAHHGYNEGYKSEQETMN